MEGFWPIFFLLVVLKIPVFGALWLVWWASQAPKPEEATDDSDGNFKRRNPSQIFPAAHAEALMEAAQAVP